MLDYIYISDNEVYLYILMVIFSICIAFLIILEKKRINKIKEEIEYQKNISNDLVKIFNNIINKNVNSKKM